MKDTLQLTLTALVDRIIPKDDWPSASENNVVPFIWNLLGHERRGDQAFVVAGLQALDVESAKRFSTTFAEAPAESQDALLTDIEKNRTQIDWPIAAARWFELLVSITQEGYYADRSNGANLEHVSWKMVGFEPRRPI